MAGQTQYYHLPNDKQIGKIREVLDEMGYTAPGLFTAHFTNGDSLQLAIPKKEPEIESFEARKAETLATITNKQSLPSYAEYGNAMGSIYIRFKSSKGEWVSGKIDFYDVIEAVARRVVMKSSQTPVTP